MSPNRRGDNGNNRPNHAKFPDEYRGAHLLGVTGDGHAAYLSTDKVIFFAGHDSAGRLQSPPPGFGRASEVDLNQFNLTVASFVRQTVAEYGKWQSLTGFTKRKLDYATRNVVEQADGTN